MSVENTNIIDVVSEDKSGNIVLSTVDDLTWDKENTHLLMLQNKLNVYLDAIENGSLYESYPNAEGGKINICVNLKHFPKEDAENFLKITKQVIDEVGYGFTYINLI